MVEQACAVIIGYGPGLGAAIARAFAREGMVLALIARDAGKLASEVTALRQAGIVAEGFAADAGDPASLTGALTAARQKFGNPEVLVYNAATYRPGPVLATNPADLAADFNTCVIGGLVAAQAVAPAMRQRKSGSLLFTGGGFALYPSPAAPTLSIGKGGLRSLALMLAQELAPDGVRVGTVTIMGTVAKGTKFDPDDIAESFLTLHRGKIASTVAEIQFA